MRRFSADNGVDLAIHHPSALVSADVKQPWLVVFAQFDLKQTGFVLYPWSCSLHQRPHGGQGWMLSFWGHRLDGSGYTGFTLCPEVPVDETKHGIAGLVDLRPNISGRLAEKHAGLQGLYVVLSP